MRAAVWDRALRRAAASKPARAASGRPEQFLDVCLGELQRAAVCSVQHRGDQGTLAVLQHLHLLLNGAERDQAVHEEVVLQSLRRAVDGRGWPRQEANQATTWNSSATKVAWARMSRPPTLRTCPFLTIAITS